MASLVGHRVTTMKLTYPFCSIMERRPRSPPQLIGETLQALPIAELALSDLWVQPLMGVATPHKAVITRLTCCDLLTKPSLTAKQPQVKKFLRLAEMLRPVVCWMH